MRRYPFGFGLDVNDVETQPDMGLLSPNLAKKRDWRASAYDRVMPHGDAEMEDGDKSRMFRQGLLHLGAGLLSNGGGFGNALGKSISGGLLAMNKGEDDLADRNYKRQVLAANADGGTAFRALDAQARAAGYAPGSKGYQDFMKRDNGEIARQSGAQIGYKLVKGDDGVTRLVALDPREVGAQVVGSGATYGSGVGGPPAPAAPTGGAPGLLDSAYRDAGGDLASGVRGIVEPFGGTIGSTTGGEHNPGSKHYSGNAVDIPLGEWRNIPAEKQQEMLASLEAQGYTVRDERTRPPGQKVWSGPHLHVERGQQVASAGANPFESRPEEDQAARTRAAEEAVTLGNLREKGRLEAGNVALSEQAKSDVYVNNADRVGNVDAINEGKKAEAKADAESKGKIAADLRDRAYRAKQTVDLLNQAESLVKISTGSGAGADYDRVKSYFGKSDKGANAIAALKPIAGRLTAQMPRMEGPQSDADRLMYQQMAGDLANPMVPVSQRLAAMKQMRLLVAKYANDPTGGTAADKPAGKTVKRTGMYQGRKVIMYTDGSTAYGD